MPKLHTRARRVLVLMVVVMAACHTARPAPLRLWVAHNSTEVLTVAAATATDLGFTVTHSDSTRGILSAVREAANEGNHDYTRCGRRIESNEYFRSIVAVTVTARDSGGGASVRIEVSVPDAYAPLFMSNGAMHWRCASSGRVETELAAALRAPSPRTHHPA